MIYRAVTKPVFSGNETAISGGKALLFQFLTFGIYGNFWAWMLGEKLDKIKQERGFINKNWQIGKNSNIAFLLMNFIGLSVVVLAIAQSVINETLSIDAN